MRTVEAVPIVIVGAGHAGLALSYELRRAGTEHVILERARVAQSWRTRWDSFCLVTPNWTVRLPGRPYGGDDPDGFMPRDELVAYLEGYARSFDAPVREHVDLGAMERGPGGGFRLRTAEGELETAAVVLATGGYQKPHRSPAAAALPPDVYAIDAQSYGNPDDLPPGRVLIVGSGQTGCQIAEELNESGRDVVLACGRAPWLPRRVEGRDLVSWIFDTPFLHQTLADLPDPAMRLGANFQVSGRAGGHDLNYRTLQDAGVTLTGRLAGVDDHRVLFGNDLERSVAFGDARYADIRKLIHKTCEERGEKPPEFPEPRPFTADAPERMDLRDFGAVVFTSGFRPDYKRWIQQPDAFDRFGFPIQTDGQSTVVPGLFFIGTHFLRKRQSATFMGIAEDAEVVAERIVDSLGSGERDLLS